MFKVRLNSEKIQIFHKTGILEKFSRIFQKGLSFCFQSVMHIPSSTKEGGIFTTQPIDWTFQCSYDTSYDITAEEMSMDASAKTGEFSGFGKFDLSMRNVYQMRRRMTLIRGLHLSVLPHLV